MTEEGTSERAATEKSPAERRAELIRLAEVCLIAVGIVGIICVLFLSLAHLGDKYLFGNVESIRLIQAKYMNLGDVVPPLFQDGFYGGTRYLPLPIALHAAVALLVSDYLFAGKLLALVLGALALFCIASVLRPKRVPWPLVIGSAASAVMGFASIRAVVGLGADIVPVLFQIGGLGLAERAKGRRGAVLGGALCALATLSKPTALWGVAAGTLWLLRDRRRDAAIFFAVWLALVALGAAGLQTASGGTFFSDHLPLLLSSVSLSLWVALDRVVDALVNFAPATLVVLVLWLLGVVLDRRVNVWGLAVLLHLPIVVVIFMDPGAAENHLLDLAIVAPIAFGTQFAARFRAEEAPPSSRPRLLISSVLLAALVFGLVRDVGPVTRTTIDSMATGRPLPQSEKDPLEEEVSSSDSVLAEDPYIPFAQGQRPVVLDPYMFARIARRHPEWEEALVQRITGREFTKVILFHPLENRAWYEEYHFGPSVWEALNDSYRLEAFADGYFVYVPMP